MAPGRIDCVPGRHRDRAGQIKIRAPARGCTGDQCRQNAGVNSTGTGSSSNLPAIVVKLQRAWKPPNGKEFAARR
jgi:hypothetical protein